MSDAAERTLKFMLGATMGFGFGLSFLQTAIDSPLLLAPVWALTTLLGGMVGVAVFNVAGKFGVAAPGEELGQKEEVERVAFAVALGAALGWWLI